MVLIMNIPEFNTLYALSSNNKIKCWGIEVKYEPDTDRVFIETTHGYVDSNLVTTINEVKSGKNIGKVNETTKLEQAILEATSAWNKKKDKGYSESLADNSNLLLPMLAHDYFKRGKDINFPCYVQPKLNGVRMLSYKINNEIVLYSRNGKLFNSLQHISSQLFDLLDERKYLDGEIYNPDLDLQDIVSILKSEKEDRGRDKLQYWIYDFPNDKPFNYRLQSLQELQSKLPTDGSIQIVPTYDCIDSENIRSYFSTFITEGNEGLILRNSEGLYSFNHRSKDLQKYKEFQSDEFEIIDVIGGEIGKSEEDCAIFVCKTSSGSSFNVRPKGSRQSRRDCLKDRESIIGKLLTVKYFEYTPDQIPFHPVGETIRDYE